MGTDRRIKATLTGYTEWAFKRYKKLNGKNDSAALELIIDRWLSLDSGFAEQNGLTLQDFNRERGFGEVVPIEERR